MTLDGDYPTVEVKETLQRVGHELVLGKRKSKESSRQIPLPAPTVAMLRRHKVAQNERRLMAGEDWHDEDFLIDRGDGEPLSPDSHLHIFAVAAKKVGLGGARLHEYRGMVARSPGEGSTTSDFLGDAATVGARASFKARAPLNPPSPKPGGIARLAFHSSRNRGWRP